jgi:hypothetical protein
MNLVVMVGTTSTSSLIKAEKWDDVEVVPAGFAERKRREANSYS